MNEILVGHAEWQMLTALKRLGGFANLPELSQESGRPYGTVRTALHELKLKGAIVSLGFKKGYRLQSGIRVVDKHERENAALAGGRRWKREKRDLRLNIPVNAHEIAGVREAARRNNMSLSAFVRHRLAVAGEGEYADR